MRILFKKRNDYTVTNKYYLLLQDKWARKMNDLTSGMSKKMLVFTLGVFIILSGSLCGFIIWQGFNIKGGDAVKIIPVTRAIDASKVPFSKPFLQGELQRIKKFEVYLDSLKSNGSAEKTFDTVELLRPGLMDSI